MIFIDVKAIRVAPLTKRRLSGVLTDYAAFAISTKRTTELVVQNITLRKTPVLFLLFASTLLASCGITPTKIASNKSSAYVSQPKKIYALIAIDEIDSLYDVPFFPEMRKKYTEGFTQRLAEIMRECSVELTATAMTDDVNSADVKNTLQNAKPDVLLQVRLASYRKVGSVVKSATYDASMLDSATKEMVWRANLEFSLNMEEHTSGMATPYKFFSMRGGDLAVDLTNQMKTDDILATCALIPPRK